MQVRIDHLDANPFRHIDRYPIREDKITALIESIESTGFWDNMVGRVVDARQGEAVTVQIAYGHHRREALRRVYPPGHMVGIVVRDFTDDDMLKIMARENMEEWGSSASIEHETVRAVVEAYGDGLIELPAPAARRDKWRWAPGFLTSPDDRTATFGRPYTAQEVATFLGWHSEKVKRALQALSLIQQGDLADADFTDLGTEAATALVRETNDTLRQQERQREAEARRVAEIERQRAAAAEREARAEQERAAARERARNARETADRQAAERQAAAMEEQRATAAAARAEAEARRSAAKRDMAHQEAERTKVRKDVTKSMRTNLRNPNVGINQARKEARDERAKYTPDNSAPMDFGRFVRGLASRLARLLTSGDYADALAQIRRYRVHIPTGDGDQLVAALEDMRKIIDDHLALLGASDQSPSVEIIDAEIVEGVHSA